MPADPAKTNRDVLPAMEEGLRCAGLAAVVGEVHATLAHLFAPRCGPM
jgi:hypothetical protein